MCVCLSACFTNRQSLRCCTHFLHFDCLIFFPFFFRAASKLVSMMAYVDAVADALATDDGVPLLLKVAKSSAGNLTDKFSVLRILEKVFERESRWISRIAEYGGIQVNFAGVILLLLDAEDFGKSHSKSATIYPC